MKYLKTYESTNNKCSNSFIERNFDDLYYLKSWVDNGCDINWEDGDYLSLLHLNVYHGLTENVKFLIDNGADVNQQNDYGNTPLHRIIQDKNENTRKNVLDLLINAGANWNILNIAGNDFLDVFKLYYDGEDEYEYVIKTWPKKYELYLKQKKANDFNL